MNKSHSQLLHLLNDGCFHSGDELALHLLVTRASISKWVKKINQNLVLIDSVKGKGYRLAANIRLLEKSKIEQALGSELELIISEQSESTNDTVKAQLRQAAQPLVKPILASTEKQTQGRGRRGRQWVSPYAENLYFSAGFELDLSLAELNGLSLVVGIAITKVLESLSYPISLKWPNDVYLNGQKVAGVLVELEGGFDSPCRIVIGIGLNVNMAPCNILTDAIDQEWTSLCQHSGQYEDRSELLVKLYQQLDLELKDFVKQGFKPFIEQWAKYDHFKQQQVRLLMPNKEIEGLVVGVDEQGALILDTNEGEQCFIAGEVSLRKKDVSH